MLNFALVGCGRIAKRHSELLGNNKIKDARLAAVCDIKEERARAIGEKFGVAYYVDMNEMMESEQIDAISILTESGNHSSHTIRLKK